MNTAFATMIPKEMIQSLRFPSQEVLTNADERKTREVQLQKACELGNNYNGKVEIVFQTTEGPKAVKTTIWGVNAESISLKNGAWIPIKSIFSVII